LSGLGTLTVYDRGRRARLAPLLLACRDIERVVEALQHAIPVPQHEVGMRRALGRQVLWKRLPLATGRKHVEDNANLRLSAMRVAFARNASATGSSNNSPHVSPNSFIQRSNIHMRLHAVELNVCSDRITLALPVDSITDDQNRYMVKRVRRFPVGDRAVENRPQLIVGANLYVKVSTRRLMLSSEMQSAFVV
jgi:hypothetical protein